MQTVPQRVLKKEDSLHLQKGPVDRKTKRVMNINDRDEKHHRDRKRFAKL